MKHRLFLILDSKCTYNYIITIFTYPKSYPLFDISHPEEFFIKLEHNTASFIPPVTTLTELMIPGTLFPHILKWTILPFFTDKTTCPCRSSCNIIRIDKRIIVQGIVTSTKERRLQTFRSPHFPLK